MTANEILTLGRGLLDDEKVPYLWSTDFLVACLNRSINDVAKKVKCLRDSSTASICQFYALAGVHTYDISNKIVEILSIQLSEATKPLERVTQRVLDRNRYAWRKSTGTPTYYLPEEEHLQVRLYPYYPDDYVVEGSSNISFVAATKKITKAAGLSIFEQGDMINISGTTSNNGNVTVDTVSDTEIVVLETLVNENNTSAVLRRVEETVEMSVARLPLTAIASADLTVEPPFAEVYHDGLVEGVLKYAYLKQDTETYDPQKSARHGLAFDAFIKEMQGDYRKKMHIDWVAGPHRGAI